MRKKNKLICNLLNSKLTINCGTMIFPGHEINSPRSCSIKSIIQSIENQKLIYTFSYLSFATVH